MNPVLRSYAGNPENQDQAKAFTWGEYAALVVADGAGGRAGGAEAAALAVELVQERAGSLRGPSACEAALREIDQAIAHDEKSGETTCALAVTNGDQIYGASVGDSGVWLISDAGFCDLTRLQRRKPFLGSGCAVPSSFVHPVKRGEIELLATDGLLKYTSAELILRTCRAHPLEIAAEELIALVRYPSGAFPDDVTVILNQI